MEEDDDDEFDGETSSSFHFKIVDSNLNLNNNIAYQMTDELKRCYHSKKGPSQNWMFEFLSSFIVMTRRLIWFC